jgi:transcriptional regulator with XRE-family HTH domain
MSRPHTPFAQHLRLARKCREFSQKGLARLAGLSQPIVSQLESGARAPSLRNLLRLADALGVTTDFLLGRTVPSACAGPLVDYLAQALQGMAIRDMELMAEVATLMLHRHTQDGPRDGEAAPTSRQQGHAEHKGD